MRLKQSENILGQCGEDNFPSTSTYSLVVECNPSKVVTRVRFPLSAIFVRVAQWIERKTTDLEVVGSTPIVDTINPNFLKSLYGFKNRIIIGEWMLEIGESNIQCTGI